MKIAVYFAICILEILSLVALMQIPLVTDLITATGYSEAEVFSGIASILLILQTFAYALTWRP